MSFRAVDTSVSYNEINSFAYKDYDNLLVEYTAAWQLSEKHQLGFYNIIF